LATRVLGVKYKDDDFVIMKSSQNEEYKCYLPSESDTSASDDADPGQPAEDLLKSLFIPTKAGKHQCSYRLEVR